MCKVNEQLFYNTQFNYSEVTGDKALPGVSEICESIGYQKASISVPVKVTPFANVGETIVHCLSDPIITQCGNCSFTITQNICVTVPIQFGATSRVGSPTVRCSHTICSDTFTSCEKLDDMQLAELALNY